MNNQEPQIDKDFPCPFLIRSSDAYKEFLKKLNIGDSFLVEGISEKSRYYQAAYGVYAKDEKGEDNGRIRLRAKPCGTAFRIWRVE